MSTQGVSRRDEVDDLDQQLRAGMYRALPLQLEVAAGTIRELLALVARYEGALREIVELDSADTDAGVGQTVAAEALGDK